LKGVKSTNKQYDLLKYIKYCSLLFLITATVTLYGYSFIQAVQNTIILGLPLKSCPPTQLELLLLLPDVIISIQNLNGQLMHTMHSYDCARFEVFTAVMIQVEVFWVMMLCSVAVGYQRFEGPYRPHF
jgi:hypothetical protein